VSGEHAERHRRKLYGRRKGPKLSPHKSQLFETLLPKLALDIRAGADPRSYFSPPPRGEVASDSERVGGLREIPPPDPSSLRSNGPTSPQGGGHSEIEDVWLEIGFGAGEHLLWQAQQHPHVGLIGAEPYESGVAKLLTKFDAAPPNNLRIHMGDARDIIEVLPDASLGRVFILFPDPWPKLRHAKRRFIKTEMLNDLARVMKPGAELRFASDDAPLVEYTLERLMAHPAFGWTATRPSDWRARPPDWPQTRYEAKQLHGVPAFMRFVRV
jgi:tRNA (guanine-N7-)-methyltransferase